MDTDRLEKQLPNWKRLMYLAVSSAATLLVASIDELRWVAWFVLQILFTSVAFYLLWGKNWKNQPLSWERMNIIIGFFLASLLLLFIPTMLAREACFVIPAFAYSIFLLIIYWRTHKKLSESEDMFP